MSAIFSKPSVPDVKPQIDQQAILDAEMRERRRLAGAAGRGGTILGGSDEEGRLGRSLLGRGSSIAGGAPGNGMKKSLLG